VTMEIRVLRAFVAVVEEGGLSAAARRLHMSQPSLSQTIQALEKQLGVSLLERDHTGVRPTERGALLLREARGLIDYHDRIVATVGVGDHANTMPLRVGVPLELPPDFLPAAIARVTAIFPDLDVQFRHARTTDQVTELRTGGIDIALLRDRLADPNIDTALAIEEPMGAIMTAAHAEELAHPAGVSLQHLAGLRWAGFPRNDAPAWHDQVSAILRSHGVEGIDSVAAHDRPVTAEVKLAAAATGQAFALASAAWARLLPTGLVWLPLTGNPIVRRTWAAWRTDPRRRDLAYLVSELELTT